VGVIAILEKPGALSELLLQKQYGPPIGKAGAPYGSIVGLVPGRLALSTVCIDRLALRFWLAWSTLRSHQMNVLFVNCLRGRDIIELL